MHRFPRIIPACPAHGAYRPMLFGLTAKAGFIVAAVRNTRAPPRVLLRLGSDEMKKGGRIFPRPVRRSCPWPSSRYAPNELPAVWFIWFQPKNRLRQGTAAARLMR